MRGDPRWTTAFVTVRSHEQTDKPDDHRVSDARHHAPEFPTGLDQAPKHRSPKPEVKDDSRKGSIEPQRRAGRCKQQAGEKVISGAAELDESESRDELGEAQGEQRERNQATPPRQAGVVKCWPIRC